MTIGRKIVGIKTELGVFPKSFIGYCPPGVLHAWIGVSRPKSPN
jgi:hypothetical protein